MTLPDQFDITGWCRDDHMTVAHCEAIDGVWVSTVVDADDLRRADEQYERDRLVRLRDELRRED